MTAKRLTGSEAELMALNNTIMQGMAEQYGTEGVQYFEIQGDEAGPFVVIQTDSRNPLQYLTPEQIGRLTDYTPEPKPMP